MTDPQLETIADPNPGSDPRLYEVLVEAADGSRTVHRLTASSPEEAGAAYAGDNVLGVAPAGLGLGSGDPK